MNARQRLFLKYSSIVLFSLLAPFFLGSGSDRASLAHAQNEPAYDAEADELYKEMPESMPKDYTDQEIDRMLDDVQQIDDSKDLEGKEETTAPAVTDEDRALIEDIRENPEKYAEYIKDREWLDDHPVVIWSVCSDYVWIDAHPQFAARIYLEYDFWSRYPYVAYVLACNRPYLIRYPRISLVFYGYDGWFIQYPFIACEVFRNYVIFNRYPDLYHRYYRHHEWLHRHPRAMKVACGNRELLKSHVGYLSRIYQYRRESIKSRHITPRHMTKMYDRWKSDPRHNRDYKPSGTNKEWKHAPERQRDRNLKRGEGSGKLKYKEGGKSEKLIKRSKEYKPDREYKRGMTPPADKKIIGGREGGRGQSRSDLIKRGNEYKPDREYKRGMAPPANKNIMRDRGGGRSGGPKGDGNPRGEQGKGGGHQQGERGRGGR